MKGLIFERNKNGRGREEGKKKKEENLPHFIFTKHTRGFLVDDSPVYGDSWGF